MDNFNTLSCDGKAVKWLQIDRRIVYSALSNCADSMFSDMDAQISAGGVAGTTTYTAYSGAASYTCSVYNTVSCNLAEPGSGSSHLFPITPHVFVRANHYGNGASLTSFSYNGETFSVQKYTVLSAWAVENGWDETSLRRMGTADIDLYVTDKAAPDSRVPCLVSIGEWKALFHQDNLISTAAWTLPQLTAAAFASKPQPVIIFDKLASDSYGELEWSIPMRNKRFIPDNCPDLSALSATYLGQPGDSGRPLFQKAGEDLIVVSHNHAIKPYMVDFPPYNMTGPDYVNSYPVLQKFIATETLDTIKKPAALSNMLPSTAE